MSQEKQFVGFSAALDLRVRWALVEVTRPLGEELDFFDIHQDTYCLGYHLHHADTPKLLEDVPLLRKAFERGQYDKFKDEEMQECRECNDGTGNPCTTHG
jgi:hypothetical protein